MVALPAAFLACALVSSGETALYEFSADWCGPCQQMAPTVRAVADRGYPVRQVDVDRERDLAGKFGVGPIPCFVMVVDGQEVDRTIGMTSQADLEAMFARAGVRAESRGATASFTGRSLPAANADNSPRTTSAATIDRFAQAKSPPTLSAEHSLIEASVRLRIEDTHGRSFGSGTIIDSRNGDALIITCGHIFRESQGQGQIVVDLFGAQAPQGLPGKLVGYDLDRDLGFVAIRPGVAVANARLASADYAPRVGESVTGVGCNGGDAPTAMATQVTAIDKYVGAPNIEAAGLPVQGRSGGGLFNSGGELIGVCNAADPEDNEGLYAALGAIYAEIDRLRLTQLVAPGQTGHTLAREREVAITPVAHANVAVRTDPRDQRPARNTLTDGDVEVVCIIRRRNEPTARSEVVVLDRASPEFLDRLAVEGRYAPGPQLTSLAVRPDSRMARQDNAPWRPSNPRTARKIPLSARAAGANR